MSTWFFRPQFGNKNVEVSYENPLPVQLGNSTTPLTVGGLSYRTPSVGVPGIATGAAYADKDQIGALFTFPNVTRVNVQTGTLQSAYYYDLDDEGLQADLWLFTRPVTLAADNAAFVLSDADLQAVLTVVQFTTFYDANTGQYAKVGNIGEPFSTPEGTSLYGALQARGALDIAAANLPRLALGVFKD